MADAPTKTEDKSNEKPEADPRKDTTVGVRKTDLSNGADPLPGADKIKVETTGKFLVHDLTAGQTVHPDQPKEVVKTAFIEQKLKDGSLVESGKKKAD